MDIQWIDSGARGRLHAHRQYTTGWVVGLSICGCATARKYQLNEARDRARGLDVPEPEGAKCRLCLNLVKRGERMVNPMSAMNCRSKRPPQVLRREASKRAEGRRRADAQRNRRARERQDLIEYLRRSISLLCDEIEEMSKKYEGSLEDRM